MDQMSDALVFWLSQIFMLVGLFGLVIPIFPGLVVMWLSALGYGILTGWGWVGISLFAAITLLMLIGTVADNVMMGVGARRGGASWVSIFVALGAGVAGTLLFPPLGGIIAAPASILLLEYNRAGSWDGAWKAFRGLATGWGLSFVIRFGIGVLIMSLWWVWVWQGG